jgi:hypothetical protein
LIFLLFFLAALSLLALQNAKANKPAVAYVRQGKGEVLLLSLERDQTIAPAPGVVIEVKNRRIRFAASPCPDQLCVHSGWLHKAGQSAFCLPARVSLVIGTAKKSGVDAVAY